MAFFDSNTFFLMRNTSYLLLNGKEKINKV